LLYLIDIEFRKTNAKTTNLNIDTLFYNVLQSLFNNKTKFEKKERFESSFNHNIRNKFA